MLKQIIALTFLSSVAFGQFAIFDRSPESWTEIVETDDPREVCIKKCEKTCKNCTMPDRCDDTEIKCGDEEKDPTRPVCTPNEKCVKKHCECPYQHPTAEPAKICAMICKPNCTETEIECDQELTAEGCRQAKTCVDRGWTNNTDRILCEGACPKVCKDPKPIHCPNPNDKDGCVQEADCCPCSTGTDGTCCATTYCSKTCPEDKWLCDGGKDELGCPKEDICHPRQTSKKGKLCPGICPCECANNNTKVCCPGAVTYGGDFDGCIGQEVCHNKEKNDMDQYCSTSPLSMSHKCPCHCRENEICCPAARAVSGCEGEQKCYERSKKTTEGVDEYCPHSSDCPKHCKPNEVACDTGYDLDGCKKPQECICKFKGFDGITCATHCPPICDPDTHIFCEGQRDEKGCMGQSTCHPKKEHKWGAQYEIAIKNDKCAPLCPGACPTHCQSHEILCPSQEDACNGCRTEEVCREAIKGKDKIFCPGKEVAGSDTADMSLRKGGHLSMSHNCPKLCKESAPWNEVLCPTYEDENGCKPAAECKKRCKRTTTEYGDTWCPYHAVCEKKCQKGYKLCEFASLKDAYGCPIESRCVYKKKNNNKVYCPGVCPLICEKGQYLVYEGDDGNNCATSARCADAYTDGYKAPAQPATESTNKGL